MTLVLVTKRWKIIHPIECWNFSSIGSNNRITGSHNYLSVSSYSSGTESVGNNYCFYAYLLRRTQRGMAVGIQSQMCRWTWLCHRTKVSEKDSIIEPFSLNTRGLHIKVRIWKRVTENNFCYISMSSSCQQNVTRVSAYCEYYLPLIFSKTW